MITSFDKNIYLNNNTIQGPPFFPSLSLFYLEFLLDSSVNYFNRNCVQDYNRYIIIDFFSDEGNIAVARPRRKPVFKMRS